MFANESVNCPCRQMHTRSQEGQSVQDSEIPTVQPARAAFCSGMALAGRIKVSPGNSAALLGHSLSGLTFNRRHSIKIIIMVRDKTLQQRFKCFPAVL